MLVLPVICAYVVAECKTTMSEYTREEILKMIEEVGGPQNLDLSGKDLSGIDLSKEAITKELEKYRRDNPDQTPLWFSQETGGINLHGAVLKKAKLSGAHLQGADLSEAHLEEAHLWRAHLEGAFLSRAHLPGAFLGQARLEGADLIWAHMEGARLLGAHMEGADLSRARLEEADLSEAHLEEARVWRAHLEGVFLWKADLEKADLSASSLAAAYFHEAWLDQTRMTKEQLGGCIGEEVVKRYDEAKEAYLLLKNNFNRLGRYEDASWAYRKERRMERMTHRWDLAPKYHDYPKLPWPLPTGAKEILHRTWLPLRKARFYLGHLIHYLFDTAQLALCDFGQNPRLVLFWAALALFLFGLAYLGFGGLGPAPGVSSAIALGDHFVYSLFAFATMDHPHIVATTGLAQFLTAFEALVGIFLAAIFVFTLGNRISRS